MPGMGQEQRLVVDNPIVVSLFHHSVYVDSVYWIIGIALAVPARRHSDAPAEHLQPLEGRASANLGRAPPAPRLRGHLGVRRHLAVPAGDAARSRQRRRAPDCRRGAELLHPLMYSAHSPVEQPPDRASHGNRVDPGGHRARAHLLERGDRAADRRSPAAGWAALIWLIGNGCGRRVRLRSFDPLRMAGRDVLLLRGAVWIALAAGIFCRALLGLHVASHRDRPRSSRRSCSVFRPRGSGTAVTPTR